MRPAEFASLAASMLDICCRPVVSQEVTNPSNCPDFAANSMASECAAAIWCDSIFSNEFRALILLHFCRKCIARWFGS
jgi:hypothetical protein